MPLVKDFKSVTYASCFEKVISFPSFFSCMLVRSTEPIVQEGEEVRNETDRV